MEFDTNFSRILQKKREEQLEASRQKLLFESNASSMTESTIEPNTTNEHLIEHEHEHKKCNARGKPETMDLENSMLCGGNTSSNESPYTDDSFLALERQCNLEDKKERIMNANDTLLFDVEPPAELWNQTVNQTSMMPIFDVSLVIKDEKDEENEETNEESEENATSDSVADSSEETIEISPVKCIAMIRPSTIIEETSSQMESSNKNITSSMASKTSLNSSTTESFKFSGDDSGSSIFKRSNLIKSRRQSRRETFAFKRRNYTFFPEENVDRIDESRSFSKYNENEEDCDLLEPDLPKHETKNEQDQFNDTLEAMDYFLEKGRQLNQQTPATKRNNLQRSVIETPVFSCKRKRLLDEISMMEALPLPKRGPLIDFTTPEISNQPTSSKLTGKRRTSHRQIF